MAKLSWFCVQELKKIQDTKIPVDPNPKEPKAHVLSLKLALQMIPFRGVDEEIDPPSYRMPTKLHKIQEHTTRLNLQAPVSARKRALFIARRFADRAEVSSPQIHDRRIFCLHAIWSSHSIYNHGFSRL